MIAPIILVAAKVMPRRITEVRIVPKIPVKTNESLLQHGFFSAQQEDEAKRFTPKYRTAMPNNTHKNAGVTVIRAIALKIPATIPIITLAKITSALQSILQPQFEFNIFFTSVLLYDQ